MAKRSRKYQEAAKLVDSTKRYSLQEAVELAKKTNKIILKMVNMIFFLWSALGILSGFIVLIGWNSISGEIQNVWG